MLWFLIRCRRSRTCNVLQSLVGIVYGWDYDGIWSSSIPQLSFLIKEDILGECFRISWSCQNPRISPLARQYQHPQLSLSIITSALKTNKIETDKPFVRHIADTKTVRSQCSQHTAANQRRRSPIAYYSMSNLFTANEPALNTLIFSK